LDFINTLELSQNQYYHIEFLLDMSFFVEYCHLYSKKHQMT